MNKTKSVPEMSLNEGRLEDLVDQRTHELRLEITERRRIEEALRKSVEDFKSLASTADSMYLVDGKCRYQFVNDRQLSRLGLSFDEVVGKFYSDFHTEENAKVFRGNVERAMATGDFLQVEYRSQRDHRYFLRSFTPVRDSKGSPCSVTVVSKDITELKKAEERTQTLLREKETLLREIHHRVKNNMQIISSLLNLQASRLQDPETLAVLQQCRQRIRTIALVHERLYKSDSLERIDFSEYIRSLTSSLFLSFHADPGRIGIHLRLEPISLNVASAIPCGLIITELISNALKHAFPGDRQGTITVEFRRVEGGGNRFELVVRDDGVGFPAGTDIGKTGTLGLEIVRLLTEQLNGTIAMEGRPGTDFRIRFEEPHYKSRI